MLGAEDPLGDRERLLPEANRLAASVIETPEGDFGIENTSQSGAALTVAVGGGEFELDVGQCSRFSRSASD